MEILQCDVNGLPQDWITPEHAAVYVATGTVAWTAGPVCKTLRGGTNAVTGLQSTIDVNAIIATTGASRVSLFDAVPSLTNYKLRRRDHNTCAYCGGVFDQKLLTRDHIVPTSRGGRNEWLNVVCACKKCNGHKNNQTPEEAGMRLLFAPYAPSVFEGYLLSGRHVIGDVYEYLASRVGKGSRWGIA